MWDEISDVMGVNEDVIVRVYNSVKGCIESTLNLEDVVRDGIIMTNKHTSL